MIVRAHRNLHAVHLVGYAVVKGITDNVNILAAHGLVNDCLSLARAESGAVGIHEKAGSLTASALAPIPQIVVDLLRKFTASLHADDRKLSAMIVFHNTANTASAYNEIKYLHSSYNTSKTSYHYAVDEIGIYQAIPTTNYAYHAGVMDINQKSIGIEIAKSMTNDHVIKDIATKNAIKLISLLMYNYAITYDDVITHQMASGKYCPHDILSRYGLDRFYEELRQENALYKDYVAINEK